MAHTDNSQPLTGSLPVGSAQELLSHQSHRLPPSTLREFASSSNRLPNLTLKAPFEDPLASLAVNMERIMAYLLEAIEMTLDGSDRRGAHIRPLPQPEPDPPYDEDTEAEFTFDNFYSHNRQITRATVPDFNADSGGGSRFKGSTDLGPLDFNHSRGRDHAPYRGTFVGHRRRMFGRTPLHMITEEDHFLQR